MAGVLTYCSIASCQPAALPARYYMGLLGLLGRDGDRDIQDYPLYDLAAGGWHIS